MLDRLPARSMTPGRRLGLGAAVAATAHVALLAIAALALLRAGRSIVEGDEGEGDRVDVSTVGEAGAGWPATPTPIARGDESSDDEASGRAPTPAAKPDAVAPRAPARRPVAHGPRAPKAAPATRGAARLIARAPEPRPSLASDLSVGTGGDGERSELPGTAGAISPLIAFRAELKQKMRAAWRAREVYQKIDPEGRLQGALLITSLQVWLRPDGTVANAELHDSSGIAAPDTEALSAIHRMQPLSHVPDELVDPQGSALVRCAFHLDLGQYRFANQLRRAVAAQWRPARAFMLSSQVERVTRVRLMLDRQGKLLSWSVIAPAGLDLLDVNALAWARPGLALPAPPPAFHRGAGDVPVFVAFYHLAGEVHFLWPREDLEGD